MMPAARYAVSPDAALAEVEDGAVLLNVRTKRYYSLNETAIVVWRMLEEEASLEECVARLVALHEVDAATATGAAQALVAELLAEALLTEVRS